MPMCDGNCNDVEPDACYACTLRNKGLNFGTVVTRTERDRNQTQREIIDSQYRLAEANGQEIEKVG